MTQTIEMALPETEQQKFVELEQKIEIGFRTFVDVGGALLEIRDGRLYRAEYGTFEDYCRGRWGIERRQAYRLMDAAAAVENVSNWTQTLPATESQARPLTRLEPAQQREAWGEAVATAPNGKPTAAHVESVVRRFVSPEPPDGTAEYLEQLADDPDGYDWNNESEPPKTKLPLTASNHKPSEVPGYDGDEWYTPPNYIEAARRVLPGGIELDPASCKEANRTVKAGHYFTKSDNGLAQPWIGSVWLNPPYSMPLIQHFIDKLIAEYGQGNVSAAIVLVNNCTDTGWFHRLVSRYPVCFPRGRVPFWRRDRDIQSARQGQAIFYLGDDVDLFAKEFTEFGVVLGKLTHGNSI